MGDKIRVYYEVTPPSKRSTLWELDSSVGSALGAGADGIDITDSPAGESHSSAVAASVYIKLAYRSPTITHIRTRDLTRMGLLSLVRACHVWGVEDVLFVLGEGDESTGLTPTRAIQLVRGAGFLEDNAMRLGLVVDPAKPLNLERKLAAKPDFIYAAPVTERSHASFLVELASKTGLRLYTGVFVKSHKNRPVMERIGLTQSFEGPVDWEIVDTLKTVSSVLIVMSPADPESGVRVLREVKQRV